MTTKKRTKRYNHAFDIAFAVSPSTDVEGEDITGKQFRAAIQERLDGLSDEELVEAIGAPFDTYEVFQ